MAAAGAGRHQHHQQRKALSVIDHNVIPPTLALPNQKLSGDCNIPKTVPENVFGNKVTTSKSVVPPVAQFEAFSVYEDTAETQNDKEKRKIQPPPAKELPKVNFKSDQVARNDLRPISISKIQERVPLKEKPKIESFTPSPMSMSLDSSCSHMSIVKSDTKSEENEKKATARTLREQFFHVAEYRQDIYNYMLNIELRNRPKPGYMRRQPDISYSMRSILVDWLVEVCEEYKLQTETLYLAVSYVDRFLSYMSVLRSKLQLVGTAAMFIASKYEEIYPPDLREFVYITDDTYTKRQVLRMEQMILKFLAFDLSTPTPLAFISHFCISNGFTQKTLFLAMFIAELTLLEADPYLTYKSSEVGAAAVMVARHTLLCCHCEHDGNDEKRLSPRPECLAVAWPDTISISSGYSIEDLKVCVRELERSHLQSSSLTHRAIIDKYRSSKFEGVSQIEAKPMYPVLIAEQPSVSLNNSSSSLSSTSSVKPPQTVDKDGKTVRS